MPCALRHIAVHVEEPRAGDFRWVLTEQHGREWQRLGTSAAPDTTYKVAMTHGLIALQALVQDLDTGPRRGPDGVEPILAPGQGTARDAAPPARDRHFGFGPAV